MHDFPDWLRDLAAPRRNHYFFGKMMGVAQFEREQRYGLGQRWLINRLTLGTGILCGLEIERDGDAQRLVINRGVAVDPLGREIVVPKRFDLDPNDPSSLGGKSEARAAAGTYRVCLTYRECAADPQPIQQSDDCLGAPDCEHDTTIETFSCSLKPIGDRLANPFACDEWLIPVAAGDVEPVPPRMEDIRSRVADMLRTDCRRAADDDVCVVLGTVVLSGDSQALQIKDLNRDGVRYIHTQAQLLDMILCLGEKVAARCGSDHGTVPPIETGTLKVAGVTFWRLVEGNGNNVALLVDPDDVVQSQLIEVQPHLPLTEPLVIDAAGVGFAGGGIAVGHSQSVQRLYLRITFNRPVDGTTLVAFTGLPTSSVGVLLSAIEKDAVTGATTESELPTFALLEDANVLLLVCEGAPGLYKLTLFGDATAERPAVRSWDADPQKRQRLDGERQASTLVSGNDAPGGNFELLFEIRVPPDQSLPLVDHVELVMRDGELRDVTTLEPREEFSSRTLRGFHAVFHREVTEEVVRRSVAVTTVDGATVDGTFTMERLGFTFVPAARFASGRYNVMLTGASPAENFTFTFTVA